MQERVVQRGYCSKHSGVVYLTIKRVGPKSPHRKEKRFSFSFSFSNLYEMTDVNWIYCGNHFILHKSNNYTLNLYSAVCQLHHNKTWGKKKNHLWSIGQIIILEMLYITYMGMPEAEKKFHYL